MSVCIYWNRRTDGLNAIVSIIIKYDPFTQPFYLLHIMGSFSTPKDNNRNNNNTFTNKKWSIRNTLPIPLMHSLMRLNMTWTLVYRLHSLLSLFFISSSINTFNNNGLNGMMRSMGVIYALPSVLIICPCVDYVAVQMGIYLLSVLFRLFGRVLSRVFRLFRSYNWTGSWNTGNASTVTDVIPGIPDLSNTAAILIHSLSTVLTIATLIQVYETGHSTLHIPLHIPLHFTINSVEGLGYMIWMLVCIGARYVPVVVGVSYVGFRIQKALTSFLQTILTSTNSKTTSSYTTDNEYDYGDGYDDGYDTQKKRRRSYTSSPSSWMFVNVVWNKCRIDLISIYFVSSLLILSLINGDNNSESIQGDGYAYGGFDVKGNILFGVVWDTIISTTSSSPSFFNSNNGGGGGGVSEMWTASMPAFLDTTPWIPSPPPSETQSSSSPTSPPASSSSKSTSSSCTTTTAANAENKRRKFKNAVVVVVESLSSSFAPLYNYTHAPSSRRNMRTVMNSRVFSPSFLTQEQREQGRSSQETQDDNLSEDVRDSDENGESMIVMPFLNSLVAPSSSTAGRGISIPHHHATTSYSIKSLISILCSQYPLNVNYNLEAGFKVPAECLPSILRRSSSTSNTNTNPTTNTENDHDHGDNDGGIKSVYMQPSNIFFDGQFGVMGEQMGFGEMRHRQHVHDRFPDLSTTTYFGYADMDMLPFIDDYITSSETTKGGFLMTLMTAVSHHPWDVPASHSYLYKPEDTTDQTVNKYIASLRYTDLFIKEVVLMFKNRLSKVDMDDTVFLITGDHGVEMGKHGLYGALGNWYESAFKVPLILYSSREGWTHFHDFHLDHTSTHVDIMPTILELMDIQVSEEEQAKFEGVSLFQNRQEDRLTIHLVSPGNAYVVVKQGRFKAVFTSEILFKFDTLAALAEYCTGNNRRCGAAEKLFNLRHDPDETSNLLLSGSGDSDCHSWFRETARPAAYQFSRRNRIKFGYLYNNA